MTEIANAGARELGFTDVGAMWRSQYDMPADDFAKLTDALWQEAVSYTHLYDRLVHFAFGALFYAPVREVAQRYLRQTPMLAALFAIGFVLSVGALYEIFEGLLTLMVAPEMADDYNGQQGDMWDAQKDMGLAFVGGLLAAAWVRWRRP